MQIGVPLSKQVSDVIRLSKENVLSNCSILVLSSVMLKSSGNTIFSKFFWNISKTRKQAFYKSIFTVTRKFVYMWLKSRQNTLLIFVTPSFPAGILESLAGCLTGLFASDFYWFSIHFKRLFRSTKILLVTYSQNNYQMWLHKLI